MNILNKFLVLSSALVLSTLSAMALSYSAATDGLTPPSGVSFQGYLGVNPHALGLKTTGGVTILGVKGGIAGNEIDAPESLHVSFNTNMVLNSLDLGLLYDGPEYKDFMEIAVVKADGQLASYTLTTTGVNTAVWTGMGSYVNISPASLGSGGAWRLINPFGNQAISGFLLYPDQTNVQQGGSTAEFGLVAFNAPDSATTISLLGLSLLGLSFLSRRNRR